MKNKIFDKILIGLIVLGPLTAVLLIAMPFIPEIQFRLFPPKVVDYSIYGAVHADSKKDNFDSNITYTTDGNRVVIPGIGVDTKILEGSSEDIMLSEEGAWRDPETSTPDQNGNMVLGGHRFQYLPPNTTTFYHLDKLNEGDQIEIFWNGKKYVYEIYRTFEVQPDESWIKIQNSNEKELTLYTCAPVFSSLKRLVIKAKLL